MESFCGDFLWKVFVESFFGEFLWRVFVESFCNLTRALAFIIIIFKLYQNLEFCEYSQYSKNNSDNSDYNNSDYNKNNNKNRIDIEFAILRMEQLSLFRSLLNPTNSRSLQYC